MKCHDWQGEIPLAAQLVFLGHRLGQLIERRLAGHGYNHTQAAIILALSRHPGVMAQDLAGPVRVEPANITRALQALERRGLIARQPHPTDGRASLFHLTESGHSAARAIGDLMRETSAELETGFTEQEANSLRAILRTMLGRVDELRGAEL